MEIEKLVRVNEDINIELENSLEEVVILSNEDPNLIMEDDSIYLGDNPDIYGVFIGKNSPIIDEIMELIDNA